MNKQERFWVIVLVLALGAYMAFSYFKSSTSAPKTAPVAAQTVQSVAAPVAPQNVAPVAPAPLTPAQPLEMVATAPEAVLTNDQVRLTFSSAGGSLKQAELLKYASANEPDAAPVLLETGSLLEIVFAGEKAGMPYAMNQKSATELVFTRALSATTQLERTIQLQSDYTLAVTDVYTSTAEGNLPAAVISGGWLTGTKAHGEMLSVDSLRAGESKPTYREGKLGKVLGAKSAFMGCGTSSDATGLPLSAVEAVEGNMTWMALKTRFFTSLLEPETALPAGLEVVRENGAKALTVARVGSFFRQSAMNVRAGEPVIRRMRVYVGPKKQSYLKTFGSHAETIMDFGFFSWFCRPLLTLLNWLYALIPNYGVAIILLTLIVRIVFWPLTHKSTVSMRKMSQIQPKIKALQAQFKDQPQKIQQETFKLYRDNKVNPFSSCLPMLIQIPIFIALFTVLRSAVELRFAPFLWISDLSQPENLLAGVLPMPLNILPILTAITMGLQTYLSPSTGDAAQKKMMTWMMPIMLLFMFYSMASALCLYWTVSQILSIIQMWYIQKTTKPLADAK